MMGLVPFYGETGERGDDHSLRCETIARRFLLANQEEDFQQEPHQLVTCS